MVGHQLDLSGDRVVVAVAVVVFVDLAAVDHLHPAKDLGFAD